MASSHPYLEFASMETLVSLIPVNGRLSGFHQSEESKSVVIQTEVLGTDWAVSLTGKKAQMNDIKHCWRWVWWQDCLSCTNGHRPFSFTHKASGLYGAAKCSTQRLHSSPPRGGVSHSFWLAHASIFFSRMNCHNYSNILHGSLKSALRQTKHTVTLGSSSDPRGVKRESSGKQLLEGSLQVSRSTSITSST